MTEPQNVENVNQDLQNDSDVLENEAQNFDTDNGQSQNPAESEEPTSAIDDAVDYAAVVESDLRILKEEFRELSSITDITELNDPLRYAALRDLGLTPVEAYLATAKRQKKDNRSHLVATRTVSASQNGSMSDAELSAAREIFVGVSDAEIRKLYKRVTK